MNPGLNKPLASGGCQRPSLSIRRWRAFTLIELLLAIVIVSLVLAAIMNVFFGAFGLRNRTVALVEGGLPIQHTLEIIRHDLSSLVQPGGVLSSNLLTDASSSLGQVSGQQVGPSWYVGNGMATDYAPWGDIQRITYYLRPPTNQLNNAGLDLCRMVSRNLLPLNNDIPEEQRLMGGVDRVEFTYYDGNQWKTSWNSTNDVTLLPKAVKVEIQLTLKQELTPSGIRRNNGRQSRPVVQLIAPLGLTLVTNQNATSGGQP